MIVYIMGNMAHYQCGSMITPYPCKSSMLVEKYHGLIVVITKSDNGVCFIAPMERCIKVNQGLSPNHIHQASINHGLVPTCRTLTPGIPRDSGVRA